MASFLQNHGDIILDAVLTDYGRKLLSRGDGSFSIVKFAFADDEIDYSLYDNKKPSVSRDSEIMKTPIMEAITNNAASMKSPLLTIGMENILFMPSMKLKTIDYKTGSFDSGEFNGYVVPVNPSNNTNLTYTFLTQSADNKTVLDGVLNVGTRQIIVDNGIDSNKLDYKQSIRDVYPMMYETQFNVYVDNRFCFVGKNTGMNAEVILSAIRPISIDDDSVALYRVTNQTTVGASTFISDIPLTDDANETPIKGPRGTRMSFTLVPSIDLAATDTLFEKYGKIRKLNSTTNQQFHTIRTSVTVEGITTGCSIEIPVMFAKVIL